MQRSELGKMSAGDALYRRLDELCEFDPGQSTPEERGFWFVQLVLWLRGRYDDRAALRLRYLTEQLRHQPVRHAQFKRALSSVVADWDLVELLAYGGIARDFHLAGAVKEWLTHRLLPAACDARQAVSLLLMAFEENDVKWLSTPGLAELAGELIDAEQRERLARALRDAQLNLSHQLVAQAHSPAIAGLSRADNSPFRSLHPAVAAFLEEPTEDRRYERLFGLFARCRMDITAQERKLVLRGADLNTTFQLDRMYQQLNRLQKLARATYCDDPAETGRTFASLVTAILRNTNGRRLLRRSTQLWMKNLVDTAAAVGGNYLSVEQSSWRAALRAGAGGGLLMAFATVLKYQIARLHLPIAYQGLAFGFNYAMAFCAAYFLHFTIATKLPANTAAALAKSVHDGRGHLERARRFLLVWRATVRLQVAGLLGNLLLAAPVAYLLDVLSVAVFQRHIFEPATTEHLLESTSVLGPSPLYAALTGVLLWLSSLVAAAVDNWTRVSGLQARIATNLRVLRGGSRARTGRLAAQWVPKLGGLSGNVVLGFLLGCVPSFFAILHLPLDIRHVTVSAASCALALASGAGETTALALAGSGVLVIGTVNVVVSFMLALHVALEANARGSRTADGRLIVRAALARWSRGRSADVLRARNTIEPVSAPRITAA